VMVLSHDRERGRVSLSTKKLEPTPGDMIRNPKLVFEKAEEMAQTFRQRIAQAEAMARADMFRFQPESGLTLSNEGILGPLSSELPAEGVDLSEVPPAEEGFSLPHKSQQPFYTSALTHSFVTSQSYKDPFNVVAILIDEGNSSEADSQSGGGVSRNIRRLMVDLNRLPEGSSEGSIPNSNIPMTEILDSYDESVFGDPATHDYQLNHDSDNDQEDNEPVVVLQGEEDDEEEEDEVEEQGVNYFQWTQPAYAQPEMTR
ncbi:hypothetical protein PIB30_026383, partial [Stylosanthes scabra]|nr:hypothetical protein [Stylosanthes scabra]